MRRNKNSVTINILQVAWIKELGKTFEKTNWARGASTGKRVGHLPDSVMMMMMVIMATVIIIVIILLLLLNPVTHMFIV
jgi:hypothetical protein